jgi:hypothetical protein
MPHKDPEVRRQYNLANRRKRRSDKDRKEKELAYERDLYQKRKADPEFAAERRRRNLEYKALRRKELAEKQTARYRKSAAADPESHLAKVRQQSKLQRDRLRGGPPKPRAPNKIKWPRDRTSSEFRRMAVAKTKAWLEANRERHNVAARKNVKRRLVTDINFRLRKRLVGRLGVALRKQLRRATKDSGNRPSRAVRYLGCSMNDFCKHMEALFTPGMSWDNWSQMGWHIDHILPLSSFDLTDPAQVAIACHYSNLQPLWAGENISKGARLWRPGRPRPESWVALYAAASGAVTV